MARQLIRNEWSEIVAAGETSSIIEFTDDVTIAIVSIVFDNPSTAKIQTTTNTREEIIAETETWFDWDYGTISSNMQEACDAPNAMRLINSGAGDISWSGRGNR